MQFGMPTLIENRTLEDNLVLCRELGLVNGLTDNMAEQIKKAYNDAVAGN